MVKDNNTIQIKKNSRLTNVQKNRYKFSAQYFMKGAGKKFYDSLSIDTQRFIGKFDLKLPKRQSMVEQKVKKTSTKVLIFTGLAMATIPLIEKVTKKAQSFTLQPVIDLINSAIAGVSKINFNRFDKIEQKIFKNNEKLKNNIDTIKNAFGILTGDKVALEMSQTASEGQKRHGLFGQLINATTYAVIGKIFSFFGADWYLKLLGMPMFKFHYIEGIYEKLDKKYQKTGEDMDEIITTALNEHGGSVIALLQSTRSWTTDFLNSKFGAAMKWGTIAYAAVIGGTAGAAFGPIGVVAGAAIGAVTAYGVWQTIEEVNTHVVERGLMLSMLTPESQKFAKIINDKQNEFRYKLLQQSKSKFIYFRGNEDYESFKEIYDSVGKLKYKSLYGTGWQTQSALSKKHEMVQGLNGHRVFKIVIDESDVKNETYADFFARQNCIKVNKTVEMIDEILATSVASDNLYKLSLQKAWESFMQGVHVQGIITDKTLFKLSTFLPYVARISTAMNIKKQMGVEGVFYAFDSNQQDIKNGKLIDQGIIKRSIAGDENYKNYRMGVISSKTYLSKIVPKIVNSVQNFLKNNSINPYASMNLRMPEFIGKIDMSYWDVGIRKLNQEIQEKLFGGSNVLVYSNTGTKLNLRKDFDVDEIKQYISQQQNVIKGGYSDSVNHIPSGFKIKEGEEVELGNNLTEEDIIGGSEFWEDREELGRYFEKDDKRYVITSRVKDGVTQGNAINTNGAGGIGSAGIGASNYSYNPTVIYEMVDTFTIKGKEIEGLITLIVTDKPRKLSSGQMGIVRTVKQKITDANGKEKVSDKVLAKTEIKLDKHQIKTVGDKLVENKIPVQQLIVQVKNRISIMRKEISDLRDKRNKLLHKINTLLW